MTLLFRKTITLSGLLIVCFSLYSQTNIVFGKVGTQVIDQDFVNVMQILKPEFGYIPDSSAFSQRLFKDYILVKANADEARSKKLNENPEVKKNLELIKQLAEDSYLNFLTGKKSTDAVYEVTDAEAMAYYNTHTVMFTMPGQFTYFVATIGDVVAHPIEEVKKQMKEFAAFVKDEFKSGDGNTFSVLFIKNRSIASDDVTYTLLYKLKEKEFSETIKAGNQTIIYMLTKKTSSTLSAFETVKETCKANVINDKRAKAEQDFIKYTLQKNPIVLNKTYFKY